MGGCTTFAGFAHRGFFSLCVCVCVCVCVRVCCACAEFSPNYTVCAS